MPPNPNLLPNAMRMEEMVNWNSVIRFLSFCLSFLFFIFFTPDIFLCKLYTGNSSSILSCHVLKNNFLVIQMTCVMLFY